MRERSFEQTAEEYQNNISYLAQIAQLCLEHNCRPILYITDSYAYFAEDYLQQLQTDIDNIEGAEIINFMDDIGKLGIDNATDFYDILHFNYRGAEKFSIFLANTINELGITDQSPYNNPQLWQQRSDYYRSLIEQNSKQEN